MLDMSDNTVWSKFKTFLGSSVFTSIDELQRLIPDSLLFGSLLLYILTQNISYGIFAVFLFESSLAHSLISWIFTQTSGPSESRSPDMLLKCKPGYKTPRYDINRIFTHLGYPSFATYSITSIATYLGLSMTSFKQTLDTMGIEWSSRYNMSVGFIVLFVLLFVISRLMKSCDSIGEIMVAGLLGLIVGLIFYFVNTSIFGKESVNFLGLPFLVEKDKEGSPIYVCSAENK
jgi:hypothetical protein